MSNVTGYEYIDYRRRRWTVDLVAEQHEVCDVCIWQYTISKEDDETGQLNTVWVDEVYTPCGIIPSMEYIMTEFSNEVVKVSIGLAVNAQYQ